MKIKPGRNAGEIAIELERGEAALPNATLSESPALFKLKSILVPVDFSEGSRKAVEYATAFARQFEGSLTLLNVVPRYPQVPEMAPLSLQPTDDVQRDLDRVGESVKGLVPVTSLVRMGDPSREIIAAAKELEIDLIILATHGRTGLSHFLLGSTAEKVVRRAGCPVLIVRDEEHEFLVDTGQQEN